MDEQRVKIIKVLTISAIIFMMLLFSALIINLITLAQRRSEEKRLKQELNRLNEIVRINNEEIDYKLTDEFIEKYSRDYQGLARKNEESFIGKKPN